MTMNVATLPVDMGSNNSLMISGDLCEGLIPGLPDPLVLEMICPNLSWRDFYILSSVSPQWEQAIRAHKVYDARVRHNSTEVLSAPTFTEVYHPGKDEWRLIDRFGKSLLGGLFVAQGQFHVMTSSRNKVGIYVQKPDTQSWALLHESAVVELGRANSTKILLRGVVAVDGEIFAGVAWYNLSQDMNGPALLQSDGYSSDRKIVWKVIAKGTLSGAHFDHCPWAASARFFLCPIEL